jgi:hypothetical protein
MNADFCANPNGYNDVVSDTVPTVYPANFFDRTRGYACANSLLPRGLKTFLIIRVSLFWDYQL